MTVHIKTNIVFPPRKAKRAMGQLKKLNGDPPHDGPGNFCAHDGYFANSIVAEFGMSIDEIGKACGYDVWLKKKVAAYRKYIKEIG